MQAALPLFDAIWQLSNVANAKRLFIGWATMLLSVQVHVRIAMMV